MARSAKTLTELLRDEISKADSIRALAKATGLNHASLVRFVNGERSMRLDLADKLAAHFGIESVKRKENKQWQQL